MQQPVHHRQPARVGRALRFASAAAMMALGAACATKSGDGAPATAPVESRLCAAPERIAELEQEVARLRSENTALIGRVLGIGGDDAGTRAPTAAATPLAPALVSDETSLQASGAAGVVATGSVFYGVHLASYRGVAGAQEGWRKLRREYPDELGALDARVKKVTVPDKGDFLRLIGGAFPSKDRAAALCAELDANSLSCRVVSFDGAPLDGAADR